MRHRPPFREGCRGGILIACSLTFELICVGGPAAGSPGLSLELSDYSTRVELGGRIKLDQLFSDATVAADGGTTGADLALVLGKIPLDADPGGAQSNLNLRESRLWFKSRTATPYGDLAGYVEIDFFKPDLSYEPRLRHAYGSYYGITGGHTYTTFMDVAAYPEINDFSGPAGVNSVRQVLMRWERNFDWGDLEVAVEEPESLLSLPGGERILFDADTVPDLVAKLRFRDHWGQWSVAMMGREIRGDGGVVAGADDSVWSASFSLAGRVHVFERDDIRFMASYGKGIGRYLSFGAFSAGQIDDRGRITLTEAMGAYLSYRHWWSPSVRSNLAMGWVAADHDVNRVSATESESFYSVHANVLWSPLPGGTVGIEWIHGDRELVNGAEGSLDRFQLTAIYNF